MNNRILFFSCLVALFASCSDQQKTLSVMDFGAVADGETLCSEAFQKAIDEATEAGGAVVTVPEGTYLCGTILLKDNVTLHLEEGAEIIGSHYLKDYYNIDPFVDAVGQQRGNCLIGAKDAENIAITGEGEINGRGERMIFGKGERSKRPFLVRIVGCSGVDISGVTVRNPAAWTIHLFQSKHVNIHNVLLLSQSEQNGDGIDIDSSEDVKIWSCHISSHDDAICFKSTSPAPSKDCKVWDCKISSRWGAFKFGTESMGNFENIEVHDCYVYDTNGGGLKILSVDGSNIKNLNIHDIEMNDVEMPIFIRLGSRLRTYRDAEKQVIGSMDGITIKNIQIHGKRYRDWRVTPPSTIFITGIPDAKIRNLSIENVDAKMYFDGTADLANNVLEEQEDRYPEFTVFGPVPAYGVYVRHAENVKMKNIKIESERKEQRHAMKLVDVVEFSLDGFETTMDKGAALPFRVENSRDVSFDNVNLSGAVPEDLLMIDDASINVEIGE